LQAAFKSTHFFSSFPHLKYLLGIGVACADEADDFLTKEVWPFVETAAPFLRQFSVEDRERKTHIFLKGEDGIWQN